jgi:radical SAM protein with 4Fe4S-binding SPASM domain
LPVSLIAVIYLRCIAGNTNSKQDLFPALNYYRSIGVDYTDVRIWSDGFSLTGDDYNDYLNENRLKFNNEGGACTCFGKVMNVSTDGTLRFCNCSYIEETIIGNILEEPLADILQTDKFTALMEAFHNNYEQIPDFCKTCDLGRARPILA